MGTYKISPRPEIDKYTYQVGSYFVVRVPSKDGAFGYTCQCGMVQYGAPDWPGDKEYTFPCGHIKELIEYDKLRTPTY